MELQKFTVITSADTDLDKGLNLLANYLYKQGAVKIKTFWDSELNQNRIKYIIEAVVYE